MNAAERFRVALRRERERKGFNRTAFAARMGKHREFIRYLEDGQAAATLTTVQEAADALGIEPWRMLADADALENGDAQ